MSSIKNLSPIHNSGKNVSACVHACMHAYLLFVNVNYVSVLCDHVCVIVLCACALSKLCIKKFRMAHCTLQTLNCVQHAPTIDIYMSNVNSSTIDQKSCNYFWSYLGHFSIFFFKLLLEVHQIHDYQKSFSS